MTLIEREKRVGLHLPVEVRGEDRAGSRFIEMTRSLNVSGGGICFESHRNLSVGTRLELLIDLPVSLRRHFGNRDVYRARAVVCRVEKAGGDGSSRIGARFLADAAGREVV
jgi:hypothetical protein